MDNKSSLKENRSDKLKDLTRGSILDKVLLFAIPLMMTTMLQQLFNATDVAVVGKFASKEAMAAVGGNAPVVSLLVNFFVFCNLFYKLKEHLFRLFVDVGKIIRQFAFNQQRRIGRFLAPSEVMKMPLPPCIPMGRRSSGSSSPA